MRILLLAILTTFTLCASAQKDPDAVQAALAILLHRQGANADTIAVEISDRFHKSAAMQTAIGRAYFRNNERETTRRYIAKAIAADPKYAPAYTLNGEMFGEWDVDSACYYFDKAIESDTLYAPAYVRYANVMSRNNMDKAIARLEDLRRVLPTYNVDIEIANLYNKRGDDAGAAAALATVDLNTMTMNQVIKYVQNLYWSNQDDRAIEVAKYGLKKYPDNKGFSRIYCWSATRLGTYEKAKEQGEIWFNATPEDSINSVDLFCLGSAYLGLGNEDKAFELFGKIQTKNDYFASQTRSQITRVVRKLVDDKKLDGKFDEAVALYQRYMAAYPGGDDAFNLYQLADIYSDQVDELNGQQKVDCVNKMLSYYQQIEEKYPKWENINVVFYKHARYSYSFLDRDNTKELAKPYYSKLYENLSAQSELTEQQKKMIVEACNYLATTAYFKHNDATEARSWWRMMLKYEPDNEQALTALSKIKEPTKAKARRRK